MSSQLSIVSVETLLVDVPTIRAHKLSVATMNHQTLVLVRITASDGIVSWGEGTTIGGLAYGEESPQSIKVNVDTYVAPLLVGEDPRAVARLMAQVNQRIQGNRFAKCAVETALYDGQAKRLGVPLSELFGGRVRESIPVAWTLASGDTRRDIAEAERMLELRRHNVFKLKIGLRSVKDDVAHVAAIKRALGDMASVRIDANQAWSVTEALEGLRMLADAGIDMAEQPIAAHDKLGLRRLTQANILPVMADEALHGPRDAFEVASTQAADIFAVKINQSGGLRGAAQVAGIAQAAGIALYGGTMLEGAVGTLASAQVFSTFHDLAWGTELFGPLLLTEEILVEPLPYRDFSLQLPTRPGLGIEIDEAKLARLCRDR
ncbi:muconate/chloromuconate family cycloisomerase [Azohydromonas lata]|uniref:Muconate/chloromuconate family cycloisomerase n=1 Tax=Azohydromonas lata TaxID=45677 RepID=A0ABU5ILZ9_9BURK|nr:muconate/chloromuconate family cycloisomerase [Azohydromonas lata]MDZ5459930.1 muconate/chloromuconate family cycloisomerase [Azohydromonas lata]